MLIHPLARSVSTRLRYRSRPVNHRLPLALRLLSVRREEKSEGGELYREPNLASVEAALLLADEPLSPRKLAALAGLADAAEARRLAALLRDFYDRGGSSFQVEELAGGYQLLTRPQFHPWLARLRRHATD